MGRWQKVKGMLCLRENCAAIKKEQDNNKREEKPAKAGERRRESMRRGRSGRRPRGKADRNE